MTTEIRHSLETGREEHGQPPSRHQREREWKRQSLLTKDKDSITVADALIGHALGLEYTAEKGHITDVKETSMAAYKDIASIYFYKLHNGIYLNQHD